MKDIDMTEERQLIEQAQDAIGALKKAMRDLQKLNEKEGRLAAANAAMRLRGELIVWHADATDALHQNFPEFASEIQTRGPGGR